MATAITATIKVYFTKDDKGNIILESFPNDDIVVPPKATSEITWVAVSSPSGAFPVPPVFDSAWAEGPNLGYVTINGTFPANTFSATINNTQVQNIQASVKFRAQFGSGPTPPEVTGGGTIRNKGTSIGTLFARENLIVSLVSLVIGAAIAVIYEKFIAGR